MIHSLRCCLGAVAIGWPLVLAGITQAHGGGPVGAHCLWMRPSIGDNSVTALYMTLNNAGAADDALLAVSTPVAARADFHLSLVSDNIVSMKHVGQVPIPHNAAPELAPGSTHVMLMGLTRRLTLGERIDVTLQYKQQPPETVQAVVAVAKPLECSGDPITF
jgi:periplasmic copper chaperone A